jgi:hypothetical protein
MQAPSRRRGWLPNQRRSHSQSAFQVLLHEAPRFLTSIVVTFGHVSARQRASEGPAGDICRQKAGTF